MLIPPLHADESRGAPTPAAPSGEVRSAHKPRVSMFDHAQHIQQIPRGETASTSTRAKPHEPPPPLLGILPSKYMVISRIYSPNYLPYRTRLVEIRAAQRTFEGAYVRTALGQFSFALIILRVFTSEFYAIGALFAVYGAAVLLVAIYRRYEGNRQFFTSESATGAIKRKFRTSGNSVALLTLLSLSAYVTLMILTWRLV